MYGLFLIFIFSCTKLSLMYAGDYLSAKKEHNNFFNKKNRSCKKIYRSTKLHKAVIEGKENVVKFILENLKQCEDLSRSDFINKKDEEGYTALHYSVDGCKPSNDAQKKLYEYGEVHENILQLLLKDPDIKIDEPDSEGFTVLHWAVRNVFVNGVKIIMSFIEKIEKLEKSRFINKKANDGYTALHYSVDGFRTIKCINEDKNININEDIYTESQSSILELLLKDPNTNIWETDNDRRTILHWAVSSNYPPFVEIILKAAKQRLSLKDYESFINYKTDVGIPSTLDISNGDYTQDDKLGECPALFWAPRICNRECKNSIKNTKEQKNKTCQKCENSLKIFELLIKNGANINLKDVECRNIKDRIDEEKRYDMLPILEQAKETSKRNNSYEPDDDQFSKRIKN